MEIKRRTDYAIRMLLTMANHDNREPLSISQVSRSDQVPYQFARSIQHDLAQAGILTTTRGAHGGSQLAKPSEKVTLLDIVWAMQGPLVFSPCEVDPGWCERFEYCSVHNIWKKLDDDIREQLEAITLEDLVKSQADAVPFDPKTAKKKNA
ncbi:MAG: Rrf2 family transcriptional regulator [Coriobacteriia bacterium]|nr:Rrf2 family transcriptional regulator [Coriobacteriia bacterium]